ncbi:ester cyclase [Psychromonas sp.]|uniref:ester cyclase n=1 Tax=Psychromonas sp. TaxID=1884585 RepID=UPI0035625078
MENLKQVIFITLLSVFLFSVSPCQAEQQTPSPSVEEHNKSIAQRYFQDVLDGKQFDIMNELFTADIMMHRPEGILSNLSKIQPLFKSALSPHTFKTTIHDIFSSGDRVFVRLSHQLTYSSDKALFRSRIGNFDVRGKTIHWDAMVILRFENGKIAEEWVSRDELGMLMQVGKLQLKTTLW